MVWEIEVSTRSVISTKTVVIAAVIGAFGAGTVFGIASFQTGKRSTEKLKPSRPAVTRSVPRTPPATHFDRLLVKYKDPITTERSQAVASVMNAPRPVIRDLNTGTIIAQRPETRARQRSVKQPAEQPKKGRRVVATSKVKAQQPVMSGLPTVNLQAKYPQRSRRATAAAATDDLERWQEIRLETETDVTVVAEDLRRFDFIEDVQIVEDLVLFQEEDALFEGPVKGRRNPAPPRAIWPNDYYYATGQQIPPVYSWGQAYPDQWGLTYINAPVAWPRATGQPVIVAVIDSGIDRTHPELADQLWTNRLETSGNGVDDDGNGFIDDVHGWDFYASSDPGRPEDNDPSDEFGHGTMVAGIIGAKSNNAQGVASVCWDCELMNVKAAHGDGLTDTTVARAIRYAVDNGADIINMSFGGWGRRPLLSDAIRYAYENGVVLIAAAGNDIQDLSIISPAGRAEVISVGAMKPDGTLATFSNHGKTLDVVAPGVDILSLRAENTDMYRDGSHIVGESYYRADGTSFAAPFAAGLAALWLSKYPDMRVEEVRTALQNNARDLQQPRTVDCSQYNGDSVRCGQEYACVWQQDTTGGFACRDIVCPGRAADQCTVGSAVCQWSNFVHECAFFNPGMFDPAHAVPIPYGEGRDRYTGFGALDPGSGFEAVPAVVGNILSPYHGARVSRGPKTVIAGVAAGAGFERYTLEWQERDAATWQSIVQSATPVTAAYGTLGEWDTSGLDGWYTVRLTVAGSGAETVVERDYRIVNESVVDDQVIATGDTVDIAPHSLVVNGEIIGQVYAEFPHNVRFRRSTDAGITFEEPVLIGQGRGSGWSDYFPATAAYSPATQTLFVAWAEMRQHDDGQYHYLMYVSRSHDQGKTFDDPVRVIDHAYPTDTPWENPVITVDPATGTIYYVSQDFRDGYESDATGADLYFKKSTDDGVTWSEEIPLAQDIQIDVNEPFSVKALNGTLHAAFTREINQYDVWHEYAYYVAFDEREGLGDEVQFQPGSPASWFTTSFPIIDLADANTVLVGWMEQWITQEFASVSDIFIARSVDNGRTFLVPARVRTDGDADHTFDMFFPAITHYDFGTIAVVWDKYQRVPYDFPYDQGGPFASISLDGGATFGPAEQIGDRQYGVKAKTTAAVFSGKNLFVAWDQYSADVVYDVLLDRHPLE